MSATLYVDFNQLKSLINQFGLNEKIELIKFLEKETFPIRFKEFLAKIKTEEINLDEITAEVESVRKRRYNAKKKY